MRRSNVTCACAAGAKPHSRAEMVSVRASVLMHDRGCNWRASINWREFLRFFQTPNPALSFPEDSPYSFTSSRPTRVMTPRLLVAQRFHGIDPERAPGGDIARQQRHRREECGHTGER